MNVKLNNIEYSCQEVRGGREKEEKWMGRIPNITIYVKGIKLLLLRK